MSGNAFDNNNQQPQIGSEATMHSKTLAIGRAAEDNRHEVFIFQGILLMGRWEVASNYNMMSIMRKANYVASHMLDVVWLIVINAVYDALSKPRSFNQLP